jgi:hypothetical protein
MDRILQAQENALLSFQKNINPGKISGCYLVFKGTNSGTALDDFSGLGSVIFKRNGETIVNRSVQSISRKNNIISGSNLIDDNDSDAITAVTFIPFYVDGFKQALNIQGASELNFEYNPSTLTDSTYSDLNLQVFSIVENRQEAYDYYLLGDDVNESGEVTAKPYQLNNQNIVGVYLEDPDDVLISAGLRQDGKQVQSNQPLALLEGATLTENNLEQNTIEMVRFKQYTDGNPPTLLNRDTILELTTSGAMTVSLPVSKESIRLKGKNRNL